MTQVWILSLAFHNICQSDALTLYQPPYVSAKPGESVTLQCPFAGKKNSGEDMLWYKQIPGQMPQDIGMQGAWMDATIIFPAFNKFGFKVERTKSNIFLNIPNATTDDEGTYYYGMLLSNKITFSTGPFLTVSDDGGLYFCGVVLMKTTEFSTGTFLAVTGNPKLTISVVQSPVLGRVPPGESVSLQCTVLSERRTAELRVLWFRAAAGDSHPEIIYTHHNSSHQCEISSSPHSCVYNLSKSVLILSDTLSAYYCTVATCGEILLGNGTTLSLSSEGQRCALADRTTIVCWCNAAPILETT
ncbi:uncharacterized protein LOC113569069 [Electrophorus electricus]|uniref:uncharacterized protein LOC113569069 n=1 Tax=Electrophorus electricus TaxID=8005 RepID=UPI0015D03F48|nr:uncharacterized protein LOC113569069 [Electrophorus electricus]